ncbi:hypothetical protein P775_23955 [Puniceibacterium antarcticum]|uniref:Uncharacterized protein n=1 Tax=Puniceibacterium antarcticum TaxID=1206336 RepID=A0A2G8R7X8_9RHOB|nr:hypothetical protein [Puniceibacterium antarcticum]PIL17634.1 hypothetical protein P775_23955 [Puniceibacterium antarcticum]
MFEIGNLDLAQLPVQLEKDFNSKTHSIEIHFPDGRSINITDTNKGAQLCFVSNGVFDAFDNDEKPADTLRQDCFHWMLEALIRLNNGFAPYRFLDMDGKPWRMETFAFNCAIKHTRFVQNSVEGKADFGIALNNQT